jgi:type IV pilus assembly protein PilB
MVATASQSNLAGLPRRLVQDGIVSEDQLQDATEAAKKERLPLIAYLVSENLANARAVAVAASHEFGSWTWTRLRSISTSFAQSIRS